MSPPSAFLIDDKTSSRSDRGSNCSHKQREVFDSFQPFNSPLHTKSNAILSFVEFCVLKARCVASSNCRTLPFELGATTESVLAMSGSHNAGVVIVAVGPSERHRPIASLGMGPNCTIRVRVCAKTSAVESGVRADGCTQHSRRGNL
jgi:hypothetical protein